jgi:hypothetical protein
MINSNVFILYYGLEWLFIRNLNDLRKLLSINLEYFQQVLVLASEQKMSENVAHYLSQKENVKG